MEVILREDVDNVGNRGELVKVAPSVPAGDGGGYLVIKNSWSTCRGDAGYYYMPYAYFNQQTSDVFALPFVVETP